MRATGFPAPVQGERGPILIVELVPRNGQLITIATITETTAWSTYATNIQYNEDAPAVKFFSMRVRTEFNSDYAARVFFDDFVIS